MPLLALPLSFASKRKFDSIGSVQISTQKTSRFSGHDSYLSKDKFTDNIQFSELASSVVPDLDPDRLFAKTVAHKF